MHTIQLAELFIGAVIAGTLDTVAGLGGSLLLLPILILVAGPLDAVILAPFVSLGWSLPRVILLRSWINPRALGLFTIGILPGTVIGTMMLESVDPAMLKSIMGGMVVAFGIYYAARLYIDLPDPRRLPVSLYPIIGLGGGIVAALLGAGHGPLFAAALSGSGMPVRDVAANGGALGGIVALLRVASYSAGGLVEVVHLLPAAVGMAGACAGAFLGVRLALRARDSTLELVIGVVLVIAGIKMLL